MLCPLLLFCSDTDKQGDAKNHAGIFCGQVQIFLHLPVIFCTRRAAIPFPCHARCNQPKQTKPEIRQNPLFSALNRHRYVNLFLLCRRIYQNEAAAFPHLSQICCAIHTKPIRRSQAYCTNLFPLAQKISGFLKIGTRIALYMGKEPKGI